MSLATAEIPPGGLVSFLELLWVKLVAKSKLMQGNIYICFLSGQASYVRNSETAACKTCFTKWVIRRSCAQYCRLIVCSVIYEGGMPPPAWPRVGVPLRSVYLSEFWVMLEKTFCQNWSSDVENTPYRWAQAQPICWTVKHTVCLQVGTGTANLLNSEAHSVKWCRGMTCYRNTSSPGHYVPPQLIFYINHMRPLQPLLVLSPLLHLPSGTNWL